MEINITEINCTDTAIHIGWDAALDIGSTVTYSVSYKECNDNDTEAILPNTAAAAEWIYDLGSSFCTITYI